MKKDHFPQLLEKTSAWMYYIPLFFIFLLLTSFTDSGIQDRSNLILFITNDLPLNDLASSGNDAIRTPNIGRLTAEGLVFENACSSIVKSELFYVKTSFNLPNKSPYFLVSVCGRV